MDGWVNEMLKGFVAVLLHEVQLPNSREAIYQDYAAFCLARGEEPLSLPSFSVGLQQVVDQLVARMCQ